MARTKPFPLLIAIAVVLLVVVAARVEVKTATRESAPPGPSVAAAARAQDQPTAQEPAPAAQPASGYVGDDTCLTCHDGKQKPYTDTPHGKASYPHSPAAKQGCETCHGPGARHIENPEDSTTIRSFLKMPPREANATCVSCHASGTHVLWDGSQHESRNLACVTCHSVHAFKSDTAQLKQPTELQLCVTCHRDKIAKADRSGHMPVREGKMQCSTCHNPHGATNVRLLRRGNSIAETCTSCHADKRGPFLWEHAPSRDGCTTCHDPHGSSNERMLVAKPPILCQRCHVATRHPSTIYDSALVGAGSTPSIRVYARSCVTCHVNIHGSNHPSGQRFIR